MGSVNCSKVKAADGKLRPAAASGITHVGWAFAKAIPVGGTGKLSFKTDGRLLAAVIRWPDRASLEKPEIAGRSERDPRCRRCQAHRPWQDRFALSSHRGDQIRAESAATPTERPGSSTTNAAWQIEVEHQAGPSDVLAYASRRDAGFALRQTSAVESGTRKVGIDARAILFEELIFSAGAWREDSLTSGARRTAGRAPVG